MRLGQNLRKLVSWRAERARASKQRLKHLNRVLAAIRNVNQLITRERDRDRLLAGACQMLVETRGFYNAWLALIDDGPANGSLFQAGIDDRRFKAMVDYLSDKRVPSCGRSVLDSSPLYATDDPPHQCGDCPFAMNYDGRGGLAVPLENAGRRYGWLTVSVPRDYAHNREEHSLLREVAGDLAFALTAIESDARRKASEMKYAAVLATTGDGVVATDLEANITLFSPGAEKLLGLSAEQAIGTSVERFCPPELREEQAAVLQRVRETGSVKGYETKRDTADGRRIDVEITVNLAVDARGRPIGFTAVLRDISDRKRADEALRRNDELLRKSQAIAHVASWEMDLLTDRLTWSDEAYRIFGVEKGAGLSYESFLALIHSEDRLRVDAAYRDSIQEGADGYEVEHRIVRPDSGEIRFVHEKCEHVKDQSGRVVRSVGIVQDITRRREAEARLLAECDFSEGLVREAPAMICGIAPDGACTFINPAGERITGYTRSELAGKNWWKTLYPGPEQRQVERLFRELEQGQVAEHEMTLTASDGQHRTIIWNSLNRYDERGELCEIIGFGHDIIGRIEAEAALRRNLREIVAVNQLALDVGENLSLEAVIESALEGVRQIVDPDLVLLFLRDEAELHLQGESFASEGVRHKETPAHRVGECLCGAAVREGSSLYSEDIHQDPRCTWTECKEAGLRSLAALPLRGGEEIIGVLALGSATRRDFSRQHAFLQSIANTIASSLHNAILHRHYRESEKRLASIFRAAPVGIGVVSDRVIKDVNERLCDIAGYAAEDLLEKNARMLYPSQEEYEWVGREKYRQIQEQGTGTVETRWRRKNGEIIDVLLSSTPLDSNDLAAGVTFTAMDITDRKLAEEELARHRNHLEELVADRTRELLAAKETAETTLAELETTQKQLVQSEKMAVLGRLAAGVAHEVNTPLGAIGATAETMGQSYARFVERFDDLRQWVCDDGGLRLKELLRDASEAKVWTLSTRERRNVRDRIRDELNRAGVEAADEMADFFLELDVYDRFAAYVHSLHGPDAATRMELMRSLTNMGRGVHIIAAAAGKASRIVKALQTYARPASREGTTEVDLRAEIEDVLTLYYNRYKGGVEIVRHYDDAPPIECYREQLGQVWTNLLLNALQAMDYRGRLTVEIASREDDVAVSFADTGCGIPSEVRDQVFEPFFTTKPAGEGSGLGLAIVQNIVERHGGRIEFDSTPGHGAVFTVCLPRRQPDA